ncbi:hypothetical protein MJ561_03620 [Klebsiella pneumoniae]|nr:hypothetical protein MJ561_03620 [Klebsiella pneumoniae]
MRGEVTVSTAQEVSEAIQVARDAFDSWPRTTPLRRARVLFNFKCCWSSTWKSWRGSSPRARWGVWSDALGELTCDGSGRIRLVDPAPGLKANTPLDVGTGVDSYR